MRESPNPQRRRWLQQAAALAGASSAPAFIRHARAADATERFALGVASGCPRPDRLVLWTRLLGEDLPETVSVDWELAHDEAFTRIAARGREDAVTAEAHSVHAEPAGLAAGRWYWYRFTALGQRSAVGRTRTAPAAHAAVDKLRFAIASCQRWDHGLYTAWGDVARQAPELVLFLGDYIYEYATPTESDARRRHAGGACRTLSAYRQRYAQYKSDPQLQAAHALAPWICIWDDHETENDWAGPVSQHLDPHFEARRIAAAQAYWEHMPFPKAARPLGTAMRIHQRYDWGRLARIVTLDDRQYRDPQACPKPGHGGSNTVTLKDCPEIENPQRSLLGAAQEQWLTDSWDPRRSWNLLAQQTLMTRMRWPSEHGDRVWTDGWEGYPAARERLLSDLAARRVKNPVVLGGDVHANFVADIPSPDGRKILASEFCATSISSLGGKQARLDAALPHNPQVHYGRNDERGYMLFELSPRRLDATLRSVKGDIWDPASAVDTSARFAVEAGRPGPQRA